MRTIQPTTTGFSPARASLPPVVRLMIHLAAQTSRKVYPDIKIPPRLTAQGKTITNNYTQYKDSLSFTSHSFCNVNSPLPLSCTVHVPMARFCAVTEMSDTMAVPSNSCVSASRFIVPFVVPNCTVTI